jgi:hypothetical protein
MARRRLNVPSYSCQPVATSDVGGEEEEEEAAPRHKSEEGGWRAQQHVLLRCAASVGGEEEEISSYHGHQDVAEEVASGKSPAQKRWPAVDLPRQRRWPTVDPPGWLQMRAANGGGGEAERRG